MGRGVGAVGETQGADPRGTRVEVILVRQAEEDALEAWNSFEAARPGKGVEFDAELRAHLAQLGQFPASGPLQPGGLRRLVMTKFKYGIFYRIYPSRVVISTLLNLRLPPLEIERRLKEISK
jgi:plasmid stabilization system protein ParE